MTSRDAAISPPASPPAAPAPSPSSRETLSPGSPIPEAAPRPSSESDNLSDAPPIVTSPRSFANAAAAILALPTARGKTRHRFPLRLGRSSEGSESDSEDVTGKGVDLDRSQMNWGSRKRSGRSPARGAGARSRVASASGSGGAVVGGGVHPRIGMSSLMGMGAAEGLEGEKASMKELPTTTPPSGTGTSPVIPHSPLAQAPLERVPSKTPKTDPLDHPVDKLPPADPRRTKLPFKVGRAIYDFEPNFAKESGGYLTFKKGDLICVTDFPDQSPWWYGRKGGESGLFLAYHVEEVDPEKGGSADPWPQPDQRILSSVDVEVLAASGRILSVSGPPIFRRYDYLTLHILLDYQRRLRAYELTIEKISDSPELVTNEEYRDLMASIDTMLKKYHEALLRFRDTQSLKTASWTEADDYVHAIIPDLPKRNRVFVDAGDLVSPAPAGDAFSEISRHWGIDSWLSKLILKTYRTTPPADIESIHKALFTLHARDRSSILQTRETITRLALSIAGAGLLTLPLVAMFLVKNNSWQLGILALSTFFVAILFGMSSIPASNILIGIATITGVLAVFLGANKP